jgi:hypothetical protein
VILSASFLAALTLAGKVQSNYVYYVYPLLCVLLAAMFLQWGPELLRSFSQYRAQARWALPVCVMAATVFVALDARRVVRHLTSPAWLHPPVAVYRELLPELKQRSCRLVMFDFRHPQRTLPPPFEDNFEETYYGPRMTHVEWVDSVDNLERLLADGRPTVVITPPIRTPTPAAAALDQLGPNDKTEVGKWPSYTYPVLSFHDATLRNKRFAVERAKVPDLRPPLSLRRKRIEQPAELIAKLFGDIAHGVFERALRLGQQFAGL